MSPKNVEWASWVIFQNDNKKMPVHARVCFSLDWLAAKLCALMKRTSVSQQFLMDVYSEAVHILECDLNSQRHRTSLNTAIECAVEMCGYPISEIDNAPQTSASKTESQELQDPHPPDPG